MPNNKITTSLSQRAIYLKNMGLQFECSMTLDQQRAHISECARLGLAIQTAWIEGGADERDILESVKLLSPCVPATQKTPLFFALEFRGKAKTLASRSTQIITDDEFAARIDRLKHDAAVLSADLIDNHLSAPDTETAVLEAIDLIEQTLKEVQQPPKKFHVQAKIEVPKFYFR